MFPVAQARPSPPPMPPAGMGASVSMSPGAALAVSRLLDRFDKESRLSPFANHERCCPPDAEPLERRPELRSGTVLPGIEFLTKGWVGASEVFPDPQRRNHQSLPALFSRFGFFASLPHAPVNRALRVRTHPNNQQYRISRKPRGAIVDRHTTHRARAAMRLSGQVYDDDKGVTERVRLRKQRAPLPSYPSPDDWQRHADEILKINGPKW